MANIVILWVILCPLVAFLIGSVPFSFLIAKLFTGKDLRKVGTQNVGGLNTMITAGFWRGFLAGLLDFSKGFFSVLAVILLEFDPSFSLQSVLPRFSIPDMDAVILILVVAFVVLGHNYSIFLKFKGGRGLGTSAGILVLVNPLAMVIFLVVFGLLVVLTKHFRPPILFAFILILPICLFLPLFPPWIVIHGLASNLILTLVITSIAVVLFPKYIGPTINMFRGKEYKIGNEELTLQEDDSVNL
ncbi:MAG: glycerol-3-phosphate acyltransferase [Candidatus Heimdallarchaeota archaeon]